MGRVFRVLLGFAMLAGRLHLRHALRIIAGCFVLLGAGTIAGGLAELAVWGDTRAAGAGVSPATSASAPTVLFERAPLPPAAFDPYAGASLRRD